jgi:hypothetical protein
MTLEELCEQDSKAWDKVSDKELIEMCKCYFSVTRPDLAKKPTNGTTKQREPEVYLSSKKRAALAKLAALDGEDEFDLGFLNRKKR